MSDIPDRIEELKRKRDSEGLNEQEAKELEGLQDHPGAEGGMRDPAANPQPPQ
jgi:hypothetical protein